MRHVKMNSTKQKSRESDEKRRYEIESYQQRDPTDVPGWLFLTPHVIDTYGVCPHMDVSQAVDVVRTQRQSWINERADNGQTYRDAYALFVSGAETARLTAASKRAKDDLTSMLHEAFDDNSARLPALTPLLEVITSYKQSKNRSKKVKSAWEKTLEDIRRVQDVLGFDMLLYYDLLTGGKVTKGVLSEITNAPSTGKRLGDGVKAVVLAERAVRMHLEHIQTQRTKAEDKLYDLICADFVIDQEGRYFKRWYHLSEVEKAERIGSFCEHYLGTLVDAPDRARLLNELQTFVINSLATKALKITEVKWSTKAGKIEHIQRLNFDGDRFFLDEVDEELKRIRKNKTEITNSRKVLALKSIDTARLNRVLLAHILSNPTHRKDVAIDFVLWRCCHCTTPQVRASTGAHLLSSYEAIWDAIKAAPGPSLSLMTTNNVDT